MSHRSVGDVRPSQILTAFGPGAMVDLEHTTVVVASIENWYKDDSDILIEPRLAAALHVTKFYRPHASDEGSDSSQGTIATYIFPEYQQCPKCNTLSQFGVEDYTVYVEKDGWIECTVPGCRPENGKRARTYPAPFVIACSYGHLDDFPWHKYAHEESDSSDCRKRLTLIRTGFSGTVGDMHVVCECGVQRSLADAFRLRTRPCTGRRPWLEGRGQTQSGFVCSMKARIVQRGASNVWFPVVRSVLGIGTGETEIEAGLREYPQYLRDKLTSLESVKNKLEAQELPPELLHFSAEQIWHTIQSQAEQRTDLSAMELRLPEWEALTAATAREFDSEDLLLEETQVPGEFQSELVRVSLLHRLREVRALVGFTRIDPDSGFGDSVPKELADIRRKATDWLPAVEVRGEGIFLQFNEERLKEWELEDAVQKRMDAMSRRLADWAAGRSVDTPPFPGARYVLLHTLAHAMIRQLALDSGYSAGAIRERIYCSTDDLHPMAGILLYTAANDSDGSLGGLVELGRPEHLPSLLYQALRSATICSSDPICSDLTPDLHSSINGAACHACMLISETSCERNNQFLDRNVLVPTLNQEAAAFFKTVMW